MRHSRSSGRHEAQRADDDEPRPSSGRGLAPAQLEVLERSPLCCSLELHCTRAFRLSSLRHREVLWLDLGDNGSSRGCTRGEDTKTLRRGETIVVPSKRAVWWSVRTV